MQGRFNWRDCAHGLGSQLCAGILLRFAGGARHRKEDLRGLPGTGRN